MKILAIIQARTGSARLPGKVLQRLEGLTVLEHVIKRVKASHLVDQVIVATTVNQEDLAIVKICAELNVGVYCGSEVDVLDRYYQAARLFQADQIVRITSDCPLMDPQIIDKVVKRHLKEKSDYTSNVLKETFPDGEDVEVVTFAALKKAWLSAKLTSEREHVTPFIRNNPEMFRLASLENAVNLSAKRWTLDNQEDMLFIQKIYNNLYAAKPLFGLTDVLDFLKKHPETEELNQHIVRNAGYRSHCKKIDKQSRSRRG